MARVLFAHPITGAEVASPVPPGAGWPEDAATESTPLAHGPDEVADLAATDSLEELNARSTVCRACPRLVEWREQVAVAKRASFAAEPYWGRPVPGWGDVRPRILIVGLAPAAHGGNRTGRIFTGDRSGDWLFASLHRIGLANQPTATHVGDGLRLDGVRMIAPVRCAPPENKPTPEERDTCAHWLDREVNLVLDSVRAVVALGSFAWASALGTLGRNGLTVPRPRPKFGHAAEAALDHLTLIGCYHPSQQNTFTGKLTEAMTDDVFRRACEI